jgi:NADH:ubiquinone oxidoreductase subunit
MNFGDEGGKWVRFKKAIGRNVPLHSAETSYETYGKTLKDGITKVEGIDSNIALGTGTWDPDWFGWLKHLDISKPKTESYIENGILKTRKKKSGGKLDKLQNYISNKNGK